MTVYVLGVLLVGVVSFWLYVMWLVVQHRIQQLKEWWGEL